MYAGSIIKIKMRKSHTFYHVQLNVLMHTITSYVLLTTFFHGSEALPCKQHDLLARINTFMCAVNMTKLSGRN